MSLLLSNLCKTSESALKLYVKNWNSNQSLPNPLPTSGVAGYPRTEYPRQDILETFIVTVFTTQSYTENSLQLALPSLSSINKL